MNAYELADELQRFYDEFDGSFGYLEQSINMLCQQADRIAELEKEADRLSNHANELRKIHANRIAELEKTMGERLNDLNTRQVEDERTSLVSTPPYAYAVIQGEDGRENVSLQFDHPEMCGQQYKQVIPLFTTPQDQADRIAELENEITFRKGIYKDLCNVIDEYKKLTPQTKPLSDEEIIVIRDSCYVQSGIDEWEFDDVNFARAIEERHGIK